MAEDLQHRQARAAVLRDLMNERVVTTRPETSVTEAAAGMVRARVGSSVVMQGSFLAGILTERDVLRAAASAEDLLRSPVSAWAASTSWYPTSRHSRRRAAGSLRTTRRTGTGISLPSWVFLEASAGSCGWSVLRPLS